MEDRMVAPEELDLQYRKLRLPSPQCTRRIKRSIDGQGLIQPILVSSGVVEGKLVVIDGFKRLAAATAMGLASVPVHVVDLDAPSSEALIFATNAPERGLMDIEEAWIVQSLHVTHGLKQADIADRLERHKSWVCRRLKLVEDLEKSVQQAVREGLLTATAAREVARLPRGNQAKAAGCITKNSLSTRQAAQLVAALRCVQTPGERDRLLADPLQQLLEGPRGRTAAHDPRLSERGEEVRQAVLQLGRGAHRVLACVRGSAPGHLTEQDREIVGALVHPILEESEEAVTALRRALAVGAGSA